MSSFTIKAAGRGDYLTIHVLGIPKITDSPYEDWEDVSVEIKAGGFVGRYGAQFLADEILRLQAELEGLYSKLSGSLKFQPLEGQLEFEITGDGRGHFGIQGEAVDRSGSESRLSFSFEPFDQSFIPQMLEELAEIEGQLTG
jgi:hypothetical protein